MSIVFRKKIYPRRDAKKHKDRPRRVLSILRVSSCDFVDNIHFLKASSLMIISILFWLSIWIQPQRAQSLERDIVPREFIRARPIKPGPARSRRLRYRSVKTGRASQNHFASATQLGLTVWRLRPAAVAESGERIIVQDDGDIAEWIPERIEANTPLRIGEKIRLSFESQQTGYLYVVDREQYANGSVGEALLIFPTTRTRNGDNRVTAGQLIEIPAQDDRPNFFTARRGRLDQIGEQLFALITPQPLPDLTISAKPLKLSDELIKRWEQSWSAETEQFEMASGGGKSWTKVERETGADASRSLSQDDPAPQTIFRIARGPDEPRLIKLSLQYSAPKSRIEKDSR